MSVASGSRIPSAGRTPPPNCSGSSCKLVQRARIINIQRSRPWIVSLLDSRDPRSARTPEREPAREIQEEKQSRWRFLSSRRAPAGLLLAIALLFSEADFHQAQAYASIPTTQTDAAGDGDGDCSGRQRSRSEKRRRNDWMEIQLRGAAAHDERPAILMESGESTAPDLGIVGDSPHSRIRGGFWSGVSSDPESQPVQEDAKKTYGQILQGRDDMAEKKAMFTDDAWAGMVQLKKYGDLVESLEAREKLCLDCARNRRLLERVWQTVSNEYYDQYGRFSQAKWSSALYDTLSKAGGLLRSRSQTYAALRQMVASLGDQYSSFLSPDQYRIAIRRPLPSDIQYLTRTYSGVGIELGKRSPNGGLFVVAPFAGSPAEEAGIVGGDRLLRVDDTPVDLLSADEAVALLRGPVGSSVELELMSGQSESDLKTVVLERRGLPLPPLKMRLVDSGDGQLLAYMRLHYFTHEGTKKMASAIREGEALGVDGYILDLRNNPGGVFEEAIAMAALWLDCNGCDVAETVRTSDFDVEDLIYTVNKLPKEIFKRHPGTLTHAPLTIITNRSSASASEVFTGALHDNKRATIVGEKTYGKGVVQYFFPMDDGSGLKLTVAKYLTPSRYDISKQGGLIPDSTCNDYPHGTGQSDKCIEEAVAMLAGKEKEASTVTFPGSLPYRWLPLSEKRPWESGSY